MIKTHTYINEHLHQQVTHLAEEKGVSMAEIIRKFIREGLQKQKDIDYTGKNVVRNLLKIKAKGGPRDLSTNLDHHLYGAPRKQDEVSP